MLLNKRIPLSFLIRETRVEALYVFIFANLVVLLKLFFGLWSFTIPLTIPTLIGTCISLLLAFRTNQSYERWWEARIVWGAIVNDSRSFIRQLMMYLPDSYERQSIINSFVDRQVAWCFVLGDSLRGQSLADRLRQFQSAADTKRLLGSDNVPNALLLDHGMAIKELYAHGDLTDYQMVQLSTTLNSLTDSMGRCERIKNTVFPRTYTFYMQVFIYLFAAILPFCFDSNLYFLDVPLVTLIASTFILIEKSAIQLQDPFENKPTDTPVTTIARSIEISIKTMAGYDHIPVKQTVDEFYSL
jgi:putative membrane protein